MWAKSPQHDSSRKESVKTKNEKRGVPENNSHGASHRLKNRARRSLHLHPMLPRMPKAMASSPTESVSSGPQLGRPRYQLQRGVMHVRIVGRLLKSSVQGDRAGAGSGTWQPRRRTGKPSCLPSWQKRGDGLTVGHMSSDVHDAQDFLHECALQEIGYRSFKKYVSKGQERACVCCLRVER